MSTPDDLNAVARRILERRAARAVDLPSQAAVHEFVDETLSLMFPHFRRQPLTREADAVAALARSRALLESGLTPVAAQAPEGVAAISRAFYAALPEVLERLDRDAEAIYRGDPAAESVDEVVLAYPGFYAIAIHRLANVLYRLGVPLFPRIVAEYAHGRTGIDIHPGATIGDAFCIDHGSGVVIGETAVLGQHVKVYQGVTLGALSVDKALQHVKRHPTIEDRVVIYANATILGGDTVIGHDSIIGGNVWLTSSVPPHTRVYRKADVHVASGSNYEI